MPQDTIATAQQEGSLSDDDDYATTGLTATQRKWQSLFSGLMAPSGEALDHAAAPMLLDFAMNGCPVATELAWTKEMLEAALEKGAHPSAMDPVASAQLRKETLEKVDQGFARLVAWDDIKADPPAMLKISPIAAVPHKSRGFRMILDLSFGVKIGGKRQASVNESTDPASAPDHSMNELGQVLPRLIYAVGTAPEAKGPVLFSKLDIKDGYWRMVVDEEDEWNFAFVLPKAQQSEPTRLVIPSSLQMGWTKSPAFFCAASETARDVAETLVSEPMGSLPAHPLEDFMLPPDKWGEPDKDPSPHCEEQRMLDFVKLLEVFVDDFIGLAQTTDVESLRHISRALLKAIHAVFPPTDITGHDGEDSIALKKLLAGDGVWLVWKELLGWLFDGVNRCIQLPDDKANKLLAELHSASRRSSMSRSEFETLRG